MKTMRLIFSSLFLLIGITSLTAQNIEGYWKGTLNAAGTELVLGFDISATADGYTATLDVPQQSLYKMPVTVTFDSLNLKIEMKQFNAIYEGMFVINSFAGKYTQNGMSFPLNLAKGEREALKRPQTPQPPFPYHSENVIFTNTKENFTLAGTLTVPQGKGPFPAVVLISGSGSQNRDEELMGHKPFAVLSDYLTRNGIAVLRYDDRGMGESGNGNPGGNSLDLSYDAEAAFDYLKSNKDINTSKIGLIGHSEGGVINYMVAERRSDVAFIVSLAGPSITGIQTLRVQLKKLLEVSGLAPEAQQSYLGLYYTVLDMIESSSDNTPELQKSIKDKLLSVGLPEDQAAKMVSEYTNPWMYYFLKYDPSDNIIKVNCPALLLNGSKDRQVVAEINIPAYKAIAEKYGKTNMTICEIPDLNHLFQHCQTGAPTEYSTIEETISPAVLQMIADFINNL